MIEQMIIADTWPGRLAPECRGHAITTRGVSEGQRWQPGIHPRSHSTPFVLQGRATRRLRSRQGLRELARLSLAYATGCD